MSKLRVIRFIGLALSVCLVSAARLDGQISGTRTFDAQPGGTLVLDLRNGGSIDVEGWDRSQIEIVYYDGENDEEDFEITFDQLRNGLEVEARYARGVQRTALEFWGFQFIVHKPSVFIERDGNSVDRQVAVRGFRVDAGDSQRLVARDSRFAIFQNGVCHGLYPLASLYPPSSCRRCGSSACESAHASSNARITVGCVKS